MRLFIAIDFNKLKEHLNKLQDFLPKNAELNLTKRFHLTLKFLGEVQQNKIGQIIDILKTVRFKPFLVYLDCIGVFPSESYIRVIWVGLKPDNNILELQKNIDESLKQLFKKEKEFKAHVTLARVKNIYDNNIFVEQFKKINVDKKTLKIQDFRLVKSTLSPKGPIYEDLTIFNSY